MGLNVKMGSAPLLPVAHCSNSASSWHLKDQVIRQGTRESMVLPLLNNSPSSIFSARTGWKQESPSVSDVLHCRNSRNKEEAADIHNYTGSNFQALGVKENFRRRVVLGRTGIVAKWYALISS